MDFNIMLEGLGIYEKYAFSVILFIIYVLVAKIFVKATFTILGKLASKTKTKIDDLILGKIELNIFLVLIVAGAYVFVRYLAPEGYDYYINNSFLSIIFIILGTAAYKIINIFVDHYGKIISRKTKSNLDDTLFPFIETTIKIAIWVVIILQILSLWNIEITPLLASAGVVGVAIAFAAQETIKNLFGGVSISLDKNVFVGDWVRIDGEKLKVLEVGVRSTKFLTLDNTLKIIPNAKLSESTIENLTQPTDIEKKVKVEVGVAYGSDPDKVKEVLKDEVSKHPNVLKDSVSVYMTEMGDYAIKFLVIAKVDGYDKVWTTQVELIENIYKRLHKENITIPFPTTTVYLEKGE